VRCSRARELLTLHVLNELDPAVRAEVDEHLAGCPACRAALPAAGDLVDLLNGAFAFVPAGERATERILAEVAAHPLPQRVKPEDVPDVPVAEDVAEHHLKRRTTAQLIAAAAIIVLAFVVWVASPKAGVRVEKLGYEVTVYNDDLALVRDLRRLAGLREGRNEVRLDDVPTAIDPTSVSFRSLTDPASTTVLEQNYEYDLASPDRLLAKFIDERVEAVTKSKGVVQRGFLAGYDEGQLVLTEGPRGGGQARMVSRQELGAVTFERWPEGLVTKPTLVWSVDAKTAGVHDLAVSYLTGGMSWRCHYVLVERPGNRADLKAWVTIDNRSGASYPQAKLKLMAGDVNIEAKKVYDPGARDLVMNAATVDIDKGFEEKSFFEYHLYTLGRPTDLANESTKQIELTSAAGVGTVAQYVFDGAREPKVAVYLKFKNAKANGLGMPLPKGVVRVMKDDSDGSLEFMGEDEIDHTPKDEEVKVRTGSAFDLVGERKVTSDRQVGRSRTAAIQVKLRNHKPAPVTVAVRETIDHNWRIAKSSHEYAKQDAHTVEFDVPVAPSSETVLTFTYTATW
jgi:hypothetical protein